MTNQIGPPNPTRAPDNQFRQTRYQLNCIRNTSLLNFRGWGRGSYSIGDIRACVDVEVCLYLLVTNSKLYKTNHIIHHTHIRLYGCVDKRYDYRFAILAEPRPPRRPRPRRARGGRRPPSRPVGGLHNNNNDSSNSDTTTTTTTTIIIYH